MRASFLTAAGVTTRVLSAGEAGPAVLLLHGYGGTADLWIRVLEPLGRSLRVVAPDLIGHGFTDWRPAAAGETPDRRLADHAAAVMEVLGHRKFAVVGSSLGGILAARLAIDRPAAVGAVVMAGIDAPFNPDGMLAPEVVRRARDNGLTAIANATHASCVRRLRNICVAPDVAVDDIALVQMTAYARPDRAEAYRRLGDELIDSVTAGRAATRADDITQPALAICGEDDIRASIATLRANIHRLRQGRLVALPRCGHLPHVEYPDRFVETVLSFLEAQPAATGNASRSH